MRLASLVTGAVAILVCAWFVLGIRQEHDLNRAQAIVSSANSLSAAQAAHVNSLLDAAGTLNPDQQVNLLRGDVAALRNQTPRAARIFQQVADREPMNINAWVLVAQADFGKGRPLANAIAHISQLDHQMKGQH
jgi:predicted Zn-dependent protease